MDGRQLMTGPDITKEVQVIQVVRTTLATRGGGKDDHDPIRRITQFWSLEGELLAESDPWAEMWAMCPNCQKGFKRGTGLWSPATYGWYCSLACSPEGREASYDKAVKADDPRR